MEKVYGNTRYTVKHVKWLPIVRGLCIPYINWVVIREEYRGDQKLILHERVHLAQMRRMGFLLYLIRYTFQLIFIGYDSMPMELEARQHDVSIWNHRQRLWKKPISKSPRHKIMFGTKTACINCLRHWCVCGPDKHIGGETNKGIDWL